MAEDVLERAAAGDPEAQAILVRELRPHVEKQLMRYPVTEEDRRDLTPDLVKFFVRNGVAMMAPLRKTEVSDADLEALAAYLTQPRR